MSTTRAFRKKKASTKTLGRVRPVLIAGVALALSTVIAGCASTPSSNSSVVVGGREVNVENTDESEEHLKIVEGGAVYDDPELAAYINKVGQRLVRASDWPNDRFIFTVIDSPDINAFAMAGGYVYINRGLLAYLDNEAELAGVLSHEIGHITARHSARQRTAGLTNQVFSTAAYILTGSADLADASNMYGTEILRGYGREHELEADGLGAKTMYNAGYDPEALLEVIGVLKNQEQYQRVKAKSTGKRVASYHGLYATHPRNDLRLQTVIRTASDLDSSQAKMDPSIPGEFRSHMEGLVWGPSIQSEREENRFYHNKLGFTFEHPPGWDVQTSGQAVIASAPDGSASLTVTLRRQDKNTTPQALLESSAKGALSNGTELDQAGLKGYTAVASSGGTSKRLAVIDYNRLSYLFDGAANNFSGDDAELLAMIESFRPIHPKEKQAGKGQHIYYIQVPRGATMASLAASVRMKDAEDQLRLINGLYPSGEPRTGDWIKMIR
ncbi:MAG: M48 family metalloprotease [Pseudomonadota bacterium]